MFSTSKTNDTVDAEGGDLKNKIIKALDPIIAEHWSTVSPYVDEALNAAQNDETIEKLARKLYPWLPSLLRVALKEDKFVALMIKYKEPILGKLTEIKAKHDA